MRRLVFYYFGMQVVILGSGCAMPARNAAAIRNPAGVCVALERGLLVFDLGFGNLRQLARAGLDPSDVTDVFFTHRHPDHVGDLAALLFMLRYDVKPKRGRLRLWGPSGFAAFARRLMRAHSPWLSPRGYRLEIAELSARRGASGRAWRVAGFPVAHPTPALAYRLLYKGKVFVYSGDTGYCGGLARFAENSDLFLLECTLPEREPAVDHLNAPMALALLGASNCKRGLLTHLSQASEADLLRLRPPAARWELARDLQAIGV